MNLDSRVIHLLPLLAVGLFACGNPPGPEVAQESGTPRLGIRATFDDGQPVAGVAVLLNGKEAGRTDSAGQLTLEAPTGKHQLQFHLDAGGGLESKAEQGVEVNTPSQEVTVKLPQPVRMLTPLEVTTSMVHLTWERSKEKDFREYKVYAQHFSSALDETTGTLVYVGTDASQTDFQLKDQYLGGSPIVSAGSDIYFRVFVLKEDGSLAGSNVLHVKTPLWDNEPHFTRFYRLSVESNFAGAWPIRGVAYDGDALWLLYQQEVGGYYDNDKLTLVRLDPYTRKVLVEFSFQDYRHPHGLAWDGTSLWVNIGDRLERFNPSTGALEQGFMTSTGTASLTWTGSHLLQSKEYVKGRIERVDPITGGSAGTLANPFTQFGAHRATGIAYRPGEVWMSDMWNSGLAIINESGTHIGVVNQNPGFAHMTFMGEKLVGVSLGTQVYIMKVEQ